MRLPLFAIALLLSACASTGRTVMHSQPMGDFAADTRDPQEVCAAMQQEDGSDVRDCELTSATASQDEVVCVDGKSVAGCFACTFVCK